MQEKARFEIEEKRKEIFDRDGYRCQECGQSILLYGTPQLAHRIANTKRNLACFGSKVVNHSLNLDSVCSLACNSSRNIGFSTVPAAHLVLKIKDAIKRGED